MPNDGERHLAADAGESRERRAAVRQTHRAAEQQEQRALHERVIDEMDEAAGQAGPDSRAVPSVM